MADSPSRNPFRVERLGGYMPFCWYGSRWRTLRAILRSGQHDITLNRLPNILGSAAMSPLAFVVDHAQEAIFGRRAAAIKVEQPVFVLGHWRSGTTFLHNLIAADPRHAYPDYFQCTFSGGFLLLHPWMRPVMKLFLPRTRPMDDVPVDTNAPFEDEFALMKRDAGSPYLDFAFPRQGAKHTRFLDFVGASDAERRKWEEMMFWLFQRFQLANPGKRMTAKSPAHTARVATLLKLFPDARFVHISRNPFEIYPSTVRLWRIVNSRFGFQNPAEDEGWMPEYVLSTLPRMYNAYERDRALIPEGRLAEIRYEDLVADPIGTVEGAYATAGIGDFEPARAAVEAYLSTLKEHEPKSVSLTQPERAAIIERWRAYFDRYGYSRDPS